jgi:serine phosphatase RsbU (regulator of sigma subunit)/CheY-like chemotaxis protein
MIILPDDINLRILVLDDDPVLRTLVSSILKDYDLMMISCVKDFNEVLSDFKPHVVLMDIYLPDGNGLELCEEVKKNVDHEHVNVIMITSTNDVETISKGYDAGASDFIRKPLVNQEVKSKIKHFETLLRNQSHLYSAYHDQIDHNKRLYNLSNFIRKSFVNQDVSTESFIVFLRKLIHFDIIDFFVFKGSVLKKLERHMVSVLPISLTAEMVFPGKETPKKILDESNASFFQVQHQNISFNCGLFLLKLDYSEPVYVFIQSVLPFREDERGLLSLYLDFNKLLDERRSINVELQKRNNEYRSEITKIRRVQATIMPDLNLVKGFDIGSAYLPFQDLSGDFYDGSFLDENTYQFILCDVSGHGIAASYIGNEIRTLFKVSSRPDRNPAVLTKMVNDIITDEFQGLYYYCTAVVCQIDLRTGIIQMVVAGHPPVLYVSADNNDAVTLMSNSPLVGLFKTNEYNNIDVKMNSGDLLFIYTDGITEAMIDDTDAMFGDDRLKEAILDSCNKPSGDIIHSVIGAVYEFTEFSDQDDDMTAICIKRD